MHGVSSTVAALMHGESWAGVCIKLWHERALGTVVTADLSYLCSFNLTDQGVIQIADATPFMRR